MLVEQIPVNNSLRNYMYMIACPETLEAIAIDPLDHAKIIAKSEALGWTIRAVVNTHEHHDHIRGNEPVINASGAKLYGPHNAMDTIPNVDQGLRAGDTLTVGGSVELNVMETPGHTLSHISLFYNGAGAEGRDDRKISSSNAPALFCGDTLFHGGIGNCVNGGDPAVMFQTYAEQLFLLPDATRIYPGHDYIVNNLQFTLDREPSNRAARALLTAMLQWNSDSHFVSDIGTERMINPFFRLTNPEIIERLKLKYPDQGESFTDELVFIKLRELRNHW